MSNEVAGSQFRLDLGVEVEKDIEGIEMGVLENGIPYLTQRGLSQISGASRMTLQGITHEWTSFFDDPVLTKDRLSFLRERLAESGFSQPQLYIEIEKNGSPHYAYPDIVCMAILEYYAFEAKNPTDEALRSFRKFSSYGLRQFIYDSLQYELEDKWRHYHDRVSMLQNAVPDGYYSVFHEIGGMVVDLIQQGVSVGPKTIPDISVGKAWGHHWKEKDLSSIYGDRSQYLHHFPDDYPQSESNPQQAWSYPDQSLAEFRRWFKSDYLPTRFPRYILNKATVLPGGKTEAQRISEIYTSNKNQLPNS